MSIRNRICEGVRGTSVVWEVICVQTPYRRFWRGLAERQNRGSHRFDDLHCSIGCSFVNVNNISYFFTIDWCVILLCFCIVKSPDSLCNSAIVVTELTMIATANRQNVTFEFTSFISVTFRWFVKEIIRQFHYQPTAIGIYSERGIFSTL